MDRNHLAVRFAETCAEHSGRPATRIRVGDEWRTQSFGEVGRTIRELAQHPTIGRGDLGDGFARGESVQITLGELSNEDLMRIWDAIDPSYRVSVPYVARVVQLDLEPSQEGAPVVAQMLVVERMPG